MDSKVIVLFNHKGGVSKTTTTYHVGWKLTEYGKKFCLLMATLNVILQVCYLANTLMNTILTPKQAKITSKML